MEKNLIQEDEIKDSNENIIDNIKNKSIYFSKMTEEETNIWLKHLNLEENVLTELGNIVKNGKDLISIYNNDKLLEKLNLDLHSNNIINDAIEEALEEQLKINIEIEKDKNIILNIENEPKYELKEIYNYLELLLNKKVFLCPKENPNEILNPNTLIYKKILFNPNKYCYLCLFNDKIIANNNDEVKTNTEINNNEMNIIKQTPDINNQKKDINKGYNSLFQMNNKNPISNFNTEYQMPSHNKSNDINTNINMKTTTDFKYQNLLLNKDKEKDNINPNKFNINLDNNNNINTNINTNTNETKKPYPTFNIINNTDNNLNKNYFTQRNFNPKSFNNNDNGEINDNNIDIFSKKKNFKMIDKMLEKEKDRSFDNINTNKNKAENRYEFVKYQEIDLFKNKNMYNNPQPDSNVDNNEVNDINNLIIKTQTPNIPTMKNKKEDSDDILKSLREKYSLQNNGNEIKEIKLDYNKKDYKPKTPITEGRRTFNKDNMKFNFMEENSNDALENKFLNINNNKQNKNEEFDKYGYLNKNKINMFNNNELNEQNNGFGNMGKIRNNNRPSPGLDFNNFQYKAAGYKSSFGQNIEENVEGDEMNEENDNI